MVYSYLGLFSWLFDKLIQPIFDKILEPIVKFVGGFLADALSAVYDQLLEPLLTLVLENVLSWLWETLMALLSGLLLRAQTLLFQGIDGIASVLDILIGTKEIHVGGTGQTGTLFELMFTMEGVNQLFWGAVILSVVLVSGFSVYAMAKVAWENGEQQPTNPLKVLKSIVHSLGALFSGPFFVLVLLVGSVALTSAMDALLLSNSTLQGRPPIGSSLFVITTFDAAKNSRYNMSSTDPIENIGVSDSIRAPYYQGTKDYSDVDQVEEDFDIDKMNYIVGILGGVLLFATMLALGFSFIRRIYDVILLYLIMPGFAASIVVDNGERYKRWKELLVGKMLISVGTYFAMQVSINLLLPWIMSVNFSIESTMITFVVRFLMIIVALMNCTKFPRMISTLFTPEVGMAENESMQMLSGLVRSKTVGSFWDNF